MNKNKISFILSAILLILTSMVSSCDKVKDLGSNIKGIVNSNEVTVYLQPYDDFTQKEAQAVKEQMTQNFTPIVSTKITYEILPNKHLDESNLNDKKTRYSALKIIKWQKTEKGVIMGLTHQDISAAVHGSNDYGILGMSFLGGNTCIVSDRRVRNKSALWKVVCHEFMHAFYNYGHCPNDDPSCIMKDAKGHENLSKKWHLCETCNSVINKQ